jgi:predicted RNase H-like HicB family nuclease
MGMKVTDLVLRCYAEPEKDGEWFAICIDLNLYARGDSLEEAKTKLHQVIKGYLTDAVTVDSEYAASLIYRKAPFYFRARYHLLSLISNFRRAAVRCMCPQSFTEYMPVKPA